MNSEQLLAPIQTFLRCETPDEWIDVAKRPDHLSRLLSDHLVCELKASQTAVGFIRKYALANKSNGDALLIQLRPYEDFVYRQEGDMETLRRQRRLFKPKLLASASPYGQLLIDKMVPLLKEELHHFYQVLSFMKADGIRYERVKASRYAQGMLQHIRVQEADTLVDKLIVSAFIEARSCERFAKLAPHLKDELNGFYTSLLSSEARHYQDYLSLAEQVATADISERISFFGNIESELITSPDTQFNFHSGIPV